MPPRGQYQSTPNLARFMEISKRSRGRDPSFDAIALDLASDIGDNRPYNENQQNLQMAGSVNTHLHGFGEGMKKRQRAQREKVDESNMMSRMVLARMNTLEEGFKDILKEVKDWRSAANSRPTSDVGGAAIGLTVTQRRLARRVEKEQQTAERQQPSIRDGDTNDNMATPVQGAAASARESKKDKASTP